MFLYLKRKELVSGRENEMWINRLIALLLILVLILVIINPCSAACISGFKWMDINRNGQYEDGIEPLLPGWNITVNNLDGTYTGYSAITDANGTYIICGLSNGTSYNVSEVLQPGWYNSKITNVTIDWINSSAINQNETLFFVPGQQGDSQLQNYMPPPQTLFGVESRFGSGNLNPPTEMELFYLPNQIYTDASNAIAQTNIAWVNSTVYDFNLTYYPNGMVYYTVGTTTISGNVFNANPRDTLNWPLRDIAFRLRSVHDDSRVDVYGMNLTVNGNRYQIENNTLNASYPTYQRETLFIRAQAIMDNYYGGANISSQGFTLTGKQKFTFSSTNNNKPNVHELEYAIYLGRATFPTNDLQFADLGNYNNSGILKGQKWNDISGNGIEEPDDNPLPGWFINVNNTTLGNHTLLTDGVGEWQVLVPFGTYEVSEVLYPNFRQTYPSSGTHTIELNDSVFTGQNYGIEFINFGNQEIPQVGNISGLKYNDFNHNGVYDPVWDIDPDDEELGISGWNISLYYQNGTYTGISQLTNNGSYYFAGLDANQIYYVEEESKPDWYNSTPTRLMVDFKNTTEYPNESLVDSGIAIQVLPVQNVAFTTKSLWGINGSFHQDIEWSPFALKNSTRVSANPHWQNNTDYDFTIVYDPSTPLTAINYTVSGPLTQGFTTTTIKAPADINGSRANPMDTIDVFTRASVIGENVTLEVTNLKSDCGVKHGRYHEQFSCPVKYVTDADTSPHKGKPPDRWKHYAGLHSYREAEIYLSCISGSCNRR